MKPIHVFRIVAALCLQAALVVLAASLQTCVVTVGAIGLAAVIAAIALVQYAAHRRLVRRAAEIPGAEIERGGPGFVTAIATNVRGRACRVTSDAIELTLDEKAPRLSLGRKELRDVAYGPLTSRTDLERLASRPDARNAAQTLLDRGGPKLRLEVDGGRARVRGAESVPFAAVIDAVFAFVTEPLVRAHVTERGDCPYCKQPVNVRSADGVLRCPTCDAVHHGGCWREHGGCSVFGCDRGPDRDRTRPEQPERREVARENVKGTSR